MARKRGSRWLADVRVDGGRVRRTFRTEAEALAFEAEPHGLQTLGDLFEDVYRRFWAGSKNERTAVINAEAVLAYFGKQCPPGDITERSIDDFVRHLQDERNNSAATVNRKLSSLGKMLRHAYRRRTIPRLPLIEKLREQRGRLRWLTREEAAQLLASFEGDTDARNLTRFLLATGCRLGEALRVEWRDVHGGRVTFEDTKNGQSRSVPLTADVLALLEGCSRTGRRVFANLDEDSFRRRYYRARDRAGLGSDVVIHTLRHTVASWLVQEGLDSRVVQEYLGHRTLAMVQRYAHLAPSTLDKAASALEVKL